MSQRSRSWLAGIVLAIASAWGGSLQAQECRVAMDLGSSGVRAAAIDAGPSIVSPLRRDIDMLAPLWAGEFLDPVMPAIESALRELPRQAAWPSTCLRLGGGFSAWRLAWRQDAPRLVRQLQILHEQTGVAVLLIPPQVEGRYGHASALHALGPRLTTSHVLDIGGGSLQVAGRERSFGVELGQKSWHRLLCEALGRQGDSPCSVQPLSVAQLRQARVLIDEQLRELPAEVGAGTLTAISRPVTRGIRSALQALGAQAADTLQARDLSDAIDRLAGLDLPQAAHATQSPPAFAGFLLSDMLLVEAVLRATGNRTLALAEADINNLPALLRDDLAFTWAGHHACYLERLLQTGAGAYFSDPAGCGAP